MQIQNLAASSNGTSDPISKLNIVGNSASTINHTTHQTKNI
jgi:hypothetical protein